MPEVVSRREVLAGAAALAPASGSPAFAQAPKPDTLQVGKAVFSSFPFVTLDVANDAGIWKSLNLEVTGIDFKGDAQVQQGLTGGSIPDRGL
jgi:ABC-type nitrate/sulfonate/bicarbonate transport system substrate-binding protein